MSKIEAGAADLPDGQLDELLHPETVPCLSPKERRKREDAVRFADASIRLAGFEVSAEERARSDRYIAGEINLAEFLQDL